MWSMERAEFDSPQAISRGVRRVNEAAERAAARGMRIAYHNHFAEFSQFFDGRQAYDLLLAQLDDRVLVELDAYWALLGGADAAAGADPAGRPGPVHPRQGRTGRDR